MSALLMEAEKIDYTFHGLPLTKYQLNKTMTKDVIAERYKWKSLLRDRIVFTRTRPTNPIECADVTLTWRCAREPKIGSLQVSFKPIIDGLIEYGIIKPNASIKYRFIPGEWHKGQINIKVMGCAI